MPRVADEVARQNMFADIKASARAQMAQNGTAGMSLRAIARDLGVTAPAIYNYFPRLDDLITALIVDAFNGHADYMEDCANQETIPQAQLRAALLGYREWAIQHPADFQLIYGNPIPAYEAPREVTVPLARRPFQLIERLLGEINIDVSALPIPPAHIYETMKEAFPDESIIVPAYSVLLGWGQIHGIVMLELFHHTTFIGDTAAFYAHAVDEFLKRMGVA